MNIDENRRANLIIGERLRALREYKALSQEDMQKRTGLFRYYISRVENGRTIPTLETLNRFARALEVPVFHLVYEEGDPYELPILPKKVRSREKIWDMPRKEARLLERFGLVLRRLNGRDKKLLLSLARRMASRTAHRTLKLRTQTTENKAQRTANNFIRPFASGHTSHCAARTGKGNRPAKERSNRR